MLAYLPILIPIGIALFILRAQILRVAIRELGPDNLHASKALGAASGWASLIGAVLLVLCAINASGYIWGLITVAIGIGLGVVGSALFISTLGHTLALGHHGGEGDKSIAQFNHRHGHWIAFAVAGIAAFCFYSILTFRF
jgi:hypothetical protein